MNHLKTTTAIFTLALAIQTTAMEFELDFDILVKSGNPSPDGNGVFSNEFLVPMLNNSGDVVFWAKLLATTDPGTLDDFGFFRADTQSMLNIARGGAPSAAGNALRLDRNSITAGSPFTVRAYAIDGAGRVSFAAPDNLGLWAVYQSNGSQSNVVIQQGENASFGDDVNLVVSAISLETNDAGELTYFVFADTDVLPSQPLLVRSGQGDHQVLFSQGQDLPDGRQITSLLLAQGGIGLNNSGRVATLLQTAGANFGIYTTDGLVTSKIMHTGEPAVDGLGSFIFAQGAIPAFNDNNQVLALLDVDDITNDYRGLFFHDGTQLTEWRRTGDNTFGGVLTSFVGNFDLNNVGSGVYDMFSGGVTRLVMRQGGNEQLVVTAFETLPPPINLPIENPFAFVINNNDQLMFTAGVRDNGLARVGLFLYDPENGLVLIARTGAPFQGDILAEFEVALPVFPVTNRYRENAMNSFNDQGEIAFRYTLENGEAGIALASVEFLPEGFIFRDGFEQ